MTRKREKFLRNRVYGMRSMRIGRNQIKVMTSQPQRRITRQMASNRIPNCRRRIVKACKFLICLVRNIQTIDYINSHRENLLQVLEKACEIIQGLGEGVW